MKEIKLVPIGIAIVVLFLVFSRGGGSKKGGTHSLEQAYLVEDWAVTESGSQRYQHATSALVEAQIDTVGERTDLQVIPKAFVFHSAKAPENPLGMEFFSGAKRFKSSRQSNGQVISNTPSPMVDLANQLVDNKVPKNGWVQVRIPGVAMGFHDAKKVGLQLTRTNHTHDGLLLELVIFESEEFTLLHSTSQQKHKGRFEGHILLNQTTKQALAFRYRYTAKIQNRQGRRIGQAQFGSSATLVDPLNQTPLHAIGELEAFARLRTPGTSLPQPHLGQAHDPPAWFPESWAASRTAMASATVYAEGDVNPVPIIIGAFILAHVTNGIFDLAFDLLDDGSLNDSYESPLEWVYDKIGGRFAQRLVDLEFIDKEKAEGVADITGEALYFAGNMLSVVAAPHLAHSLWGTSAHMTGLAKDGAIALGKLAWYGAAKGASDTQKALSQLYNSESNKAAMALASQAFKQAQELMAVEPEPARPKATPKTEKRKKKKSGRLGKILEAKKDGTCTTPEDCVEAAHQAWKHCDFDAAFPLLMPLINQAEENDRYSEERVPQIRADFQSDCKTQNLQDSWKITEVSKPKKVTKDAGRFRTQTATVYCTHTRSGKSPDQEQHKTMLMTQRMKDLYGGPTPVGAWVMMNY